MRQFAPALAASLLAAALLVSGCADRDGVNWVGLWSEGDPPVSTFEYQDYFDDLDGDGHGDENDTEPVSYFEPVPGHAPSHDDCDDTDPDVYPGAEELCDDRDNDCDGAVGANEVDHDGDGTNECQGDCDDTDALMNTLDLDHDGVTTCGADGLPNTADDDCDDSLDEVYPGAPEYCDGVDNDCNGQVDDGDDDLDLDGYTECDGDCDDHDANTYPGAPELCDGLDNSCSGEVPLDETDDDGDGSAECEVPGDCDDTDALLNQLDLDGDSATTCDLPPDCDDGNSLLNTLDLDQDSWTTCAGDCDDGNQLIYPTAPEICGDGIDNDCDGDTDQEDSDCP